MCGAGCGPAAAAEPTEQTIESLIPGWKGGSVSFKLAATKTLAARRDE
ncbi:unnamed protein product, partial [marine sediment metagenome]